MSPIKAIQQSDTHSMVDPSSLKKRWNSMMKSRRDKARSILK